MLSIKLDCEPCDDPLITCFMCGEEHCSHQFHFRQNGKHSVIGVHDSCASAQAKGKQAPFPESRRKMQLFFAFGQVGIACGLDGLSDRVLRAFDDVSDAWLEHLESRRTVSGYSPSQSIESMTVGALAQAKRFVGKGQ